MLYILISSDYCRENYFQQKFDDMNDNITIEILIEMMLTIIRLLKNTFIEIRLFSLKELAKFPCLPCSLRNSRFIKSHLTVERFILQ